MPEKTNNTGDAISPAPIPPTASAASDREIVISRVFDAPRELIWQAMTDPTHVVRWWGPYGFTTTIHEMDVRPGGVWSHVMRGPDGAEYPNKSIFKEVVKPERIVYSHGGSRKGGPSVQFVSTWTFDALGDDKTNVTIRMVFPSAAERDFVVKEFGAIEGGKQTLSRLAEQLAKAPSADREFVITRVFDAPRDLVWKAWTESQHLAKWFGPKGCTISAANLDLRPGGTFHFCMRTPDGRDLWGKWVFREIAPPHRIVLVNSFSDATGGITRHPMSPSWPLHMLSTTTFTEEAGKTRITLQWAPLNSTTDERSTFNNGHESMTMGWTGTFDQLDAYLALQKAGR